jgi:hypothetical protein
MVKLMPNIMGKRLSITLAALICACAMIQIASAQTALFIYNDGVGTPNVGTYHPGDSFTFSINLAFTPGGSVANLAGVTYYFEQSNPNPPFNFAITLRNATGSEFPSLQSPSITYPQNLTPSNANDLGGSTQSGSGVGAGTYLVANITVSISPSTAFGDYFIENTTTGGKKSVIADDGGHTFAIPQATYEIDVVPEPSTWLAAILTASSVVFFALRRRKA